MQTIKYTNGKISFIPTKSGAGVYRDKKKILELGLEEAKSLMICFLDFSQDMLKSSQNVKGKKLPKTGKNKNQ